MRFWFFVLIVVLLGGCAGMPEDLGWRTVGTGEWRLRSQEWTGLPHPSQTYLVSDRQYDNMELTVQFFPDTWVNSGVFIRCQDPNEITPFNCIEANIWDNHPKQTYRTGAIVNRYGPPLAMLSTIGKWNTMRIYAVDNRVEVYINDRLTADYKRNDLGPGHIALQAGGPGFVRIKDLQIKSIVASN